MEWKTLSDGRSYLPKNTILKFQYQGGCYKILGEPIGYGGAGILYPAVHVTLEDGQWIEDGMWIALKEWYPNRTVNHPIRNDSGAIIENTEEKDSAEDSFQDRGMMRREKYITGQIFQRGFRLTPLWDLVEEEEISLDGIHFSSSNNQYGILERLDEKGRSLGKILSEQPNKCLTAYKSICILEQVLQALAEVHAAGYLHGDIQENNIFLKGLESSGEEEGSVTLIDFGSARELLEDGATAVIQDKKLYSTSGYCAPECLSKNDGTLRLTKASDLYSVGCLMLRMFLGKTLDAKTLQLVVNGKYLYPRQAKKIGCPTGCITTVNKILEKALAFSPDDRYQTSEEMLEDVRRLKRALQPKRSAIAAVDYEAFISYCHEEKSIEAAEQIQKMIEHYPIPKPIQKLSEKKRMGKVFRDREELSSSSDMEIHLREALAHSEYLILLLSPGVSESVWVKREMEWFLQTHDREHILMILVDGELEDSFPEELRKNEKFEDGQMKLVSVESLAADIRGTDRRERKRRLRTEIFRLLAPMLNCGYDDLRQRQKEYQTRKILQFSMTAMGIFGIIAIYIGWQALQIQKNYWESLTRQSRYLAEVSSELLASGDRMAALQVAMEALPEKSSDKKKPVTAEAEASLANALYAYQGISSFAHAIQADCQMEMDGFRKAIQDLSEDGNWLLTADENDTVYLWNTENGKPLHIWDKTFWKEQGMDSGLVHAAFLKNDTVCLLMNTAIIQICAETEEILLYKELDPILYNSSNNVCTMDPEKKFLASADRYGYLQVYRTEDGSLLYARELTDLLGDGMDLPTIHDLTLSPDGHYAALACGELWGVTEDGRPAGRLLVADLWKDAVWSVDSETYGYYKCCFNKTGRLAVFGYQPSSVTLFLNTSMECPGILECFDAQKQRSLWNLELKCQMGNEAHYGIFADEEADCFLLWHDQQISAVDTQTGELFRSCRSDAEIAAICYRGENNYLTVTKDSGMYLWGGEQLLAKLGTNVTREIADVLFDNNTFSAYLLSYDGTITVMRPKEDANRKHVVLEQPIYGITTYDEESNFYSVYSYGEEDSNATTVTYYFSSTDEKWFQLELEGKLDQELILPEEHLYCGVEYRKETDDGDYHTFLFGYDTETQEERWKIESETSWGDIFLQYLETGEAEAMICQDQQILFLDLKTGTYLEEKTIFIEKENDYFSGNGYLTNDGKYFLGIASDSTMQNRFLTVYDREKNRWMELSEEIQQLEFSSYTGITLAEKESFAAVYEEEKKQISVINLKENRIWRQIPINKTGDCRMKFIREDSALMIWTGDGYLKLWNLEKNSMSMEDTQKLVSFSHLTFDEERQLLMIRGIDENSSDVYLNGMWMSWIYRLEGERFYPYVQILSGVYDKGSGRIGEIEEDQQSIYWYEPYTLDELLDWGREIVGDNVLSEAEKVKYFIS